MAKKTKKMMGVEAEPSDKMMDYEHEDNHRTLMKAGEIMSDPKKMKGAMNHSKKMKRAMKSFEDIKKFHNDKYGAKGMKHLEVDNEDGE